MSTYSPYYVPSQSRWPIVGSIGLFLLVIGTVNLLHSQMGTGLVFFFLGFCTLIGMMVGWFANVIEESRKGLYSEQMDRSFRWGMMWFIFSEVMFFAAFFGALFYARQLSVPWLAGMGSKAMTGPLLWPDFKAMWPLLHTPDPKLFPAPKAVIPAWGLPAINTVILLTSGATITLSHWALKKSQQAATSFWLAITVLLGATFVALQASEYVHAYHELGLKLSSGIYGATFFMLTGFHGAHVTIGAIMLTVMLIRSIKGHFTPKHHFAFEAAAWYWHFVDVVWLGLFVFVYWL